MNAGGEQSGSSVSDEEWERFLRESADGKPDAPKEPSARARVVARRLREEPTRPEAWRTYAPPRPRRKKGWYAVGLLVSLALLVVALDPGRVIGWFGGGGEAGGPLAAESERPDQPPPMEPARRPTLDEPFKGSPAARWVSGTAGITVPAARATGWMSTAQVEGALRRSRDFLAAASLDPGVLRGEHPGKAIALINPHQQDVQDFLSIAFRAPSRKNDPLLLFSRFDKAHTRLVGDVVKTRGRITYREGERGALQVTADVTYVYPVARAATSSDEVARTIVRREVVLNWDDPAKVITEPGTFSLVSYKVDTTNGGCDTVTGYLTPEFAAEEPATGAGGGPEVDPYDRSTSMAERMEAADEGCGTATRS
ncbi:hypothetical protein OG883_02690 [Streptomyces sp. NBC_01142]|uniref:hypothetical protein n=1 Tax=Streptomyces sp. NBC_01142 TaxID=2975865 RepID=UPI002255893E|nr:hypothetical protein [Streptomyces sp. NBC_01142]MCX4818826.1 hypothetical protein [Streptomyces sp. NBC_01142]